MKQAEYRMWVEELSAVDDKGKPDLARRHMAGHKICEMVGMTDVIRAIASDGELRPPPEWPEVDCVPVGGGPGLLTCEVRTTHPTRGKLACHIGLEVKQRVGAERESFDAEQIGEAVERGRFELTKMLES